MVGLKRQFQGQAQVPLIIFYSYHRLRMDSSMFGVREFWILHFPFLFKQTFPPNSFIRPKKLPANFFKSVLLLSGSKIKGSLVEQVSSTS